MSQDEAKQIIINGLFADNKKIISLSGGKGSGKTSVLKSIIFEKKEEPVSWLIGHCTSLMQFTTGGFLQEILLNVFNLPYICLNTPQFKKNIFDFIKREFVQLQDNEIYDLINFLYPNFVGNFENLIENKVKSFFILEKVFNVIFSSKSCILVIDNFEFIDGFSYEFILKYLKNPENFNKLRIIITYNEVRPAKGFFFYPEYQEADCYLDIALAPFEYDDMIAVLENEQYNKIEFQKEEKHQIYLLSKGNPAFFEQVFALKKDCIKANQPFEISAHFDGIIGQRLALLSYLNTKAYNIIMVAAILGEKINLAIIQDILEIPPEPMQELMDYLVLNDYVVQKNEIYYEFKSLTLWQSIVVKVKLDENFVALNERILDYLSNFTLNSIAILALLAQNLKQPQLALNIWTKSVRYSSYIGDTNLYVIGQKQCLAIINEFDDNSTMQIRYNISERLGKILTDSNPKEAMEFLPDALNNARNASDEPKETELLGYLASCCRKVGNYNGEIECTDAVIEKVQDKLTPLNLALLKCTKLNALIHIGNSGQIINMIDNEILPIFDEFFNKKQDKQSQSVAFVFTTWVKTYLILSKALIMQGNNRAFEVLAILFEIIENNKIEDELFICKVKLALASANTIKGNFKLSKKMLDAAMQVYQANVMDNETIIEWNFIDIINKFMLKKYRGIQETLFQVVTFANNNGDNFTKNILKVLLGKFFKDTNSPKQAMDIYNEQIVYFAKEKMAFCALLTWYMIADTTLVLEGPKAAIEIAEQALEVAQNPKINNFYFQVLLKIILAKSYMSLSDFDTVKINLESAINIAKEYDMQDLLSRVYLIYGDYLQEVGLVKSPKQQEYIMAAKKMYESSINIAKETNNGQIYTAGKNQNQVLLNFCKNNSINF